MSLGGGGVLSPKKDCNRISRSETHWKTARPFISKAMTWKNAALALSLQDEFGKVVMVFQGLPLNSVLVFPQVLLFQGYLLGI